MTTMMIMFLDYTGLPRAYACGPANKQAGVEKTARENLEIYCGNKKALGDLDLADPATFTMRVIPDIDQETK